MCHYIMGKQKMQVQQFPEVLDDRKKNGKSNQWAKYKADTENLANVYQAINPHKSARLFDCSTYLAFKAFEERLKLIKANFCRVRLCPMCMWRRSLKIFGQLRTIMESLGDKYGYIFVTLTVKNCDDTNLIETLDTMYDAWHRLTGYKKVKDGTIGYFRSMEITHDLNPIIHKKLYRKSKKWYDSQNLKVGDENPNFDKYHPHFHAIFVVRSSYFGGRNYVTQADWGNLWGQALKVDYNPIVDVRKIKNNTLKAVAEAAKYSVKTSDVLSEDYDLSVKTVETLDAALHKRRFLAMGGVFKDAHKKLNLDDAEDGDFIDNDINQSEIDPESPEIVYLWQPGYKQYVIHS